MSKDKKILISTLKKLGVGFEKNTKILRYNLLGKIKKPAVKNIKRLERKINQGDIFNFSYITDFDIQTEEENILNEMFRISVDEKGNPIPLSTFNGVNNPDFDKWDNATFLKISTSFNSVIIQNYLDAVEYVISNEKNNNGLTDDCVMFFISLLSKLNDEDTWYRNKGFVHFLLSCPFNKKTKKFFNDHCYFLRKKTTPIFIKKLFLNSNLPVPPSVDKAVKRYSVNQTENLYKQIEDLPSFVQLLSGDELYESLSTSKFKKIKKAFYHLCSVTTGVQESVLYIKFSRLLCSGSASKLSRINVEKEKKNLVQSWRNIGLKNSNKGLETIAGNTINYTNEQINNFNEPIVKDCRNFGFVSNFNSKKQLLNLMSQASQHPVIYLCSSVLFNSDFPIERCVSTESPLGSIVSDYLQKSIAGKEYFLMNSLDPKDFLSAYYDQATFSLRIKINLFNKERELLSRLKRENAGLDLTDFHEEACYADLCQLFPAIDNSILKLGEIFNICPLTNKKSDVLIERKEASSVLKSIIKQFVEKFDSLDVVSDLICVYLMLFDKNSLNIRNTSVHGNDYPSNNSELLFSRKAALLSLGIILDRIKTS